MSYLRSLFALLGFGGGLAAGVTAIPLLGPVLGIVAGFLKLLAAFVRWLLRDIEDAFKEPQRLAVRMVCLLAVLAIGVWQGIEWDKHQVAHARADRDEWKAAHTKLIVDARNADDENKRKLDDALKAAREAAENARNAPAAAPVAEPARVQPRRRAPAASQDGVVGSWMRSLPAVLGGSANPRAKR